MTPAIYYSRAKTLTRSRVNVFAFKFSFTVPLLLIAVILSALSIIYAINEARNVSAEVERAVRERGQLHIEWEQLLLEKSALTLQSRVRHFAESRLNMVMPDAHSVVDLQG